MPPGNRVCPQCGNATSGLTCPIDGWATVPASMVNEARLIPGSMLLGRFRVGAFLEDDGAMAIYGGSRIDNGRPVRIATIIMPPSANLAEIARMQRAARALEGVTHPNIAAVLASGTTDRGDLAIISEFIEGPTLAELLRGGELGADRTLSLGLSLFEALEAAHAAGVAHHDLSPERIRMAPGRVVICDFGLADILRSPRSSALGWSASDGEVPLLARGIPYRAPEQARDRAVTRHADIYAVGAILYEALVGRPLFVEKTSADYLIAHMMKVPTAPPPRSEPIHDGLAQIIMRCLEKKPWHRPESATVARETLEDLRARSIEAMANQAGRSAPTSRRTQRPRVGAIVEVVNAVDVAGEAPPLPPPAPPAPPPTAEAVAVAPLIGLEPTSGAAMQAPETTGAQLLGVLAPAPTPVETRDTERPRSELVAVATAEVPTTTRPEDDSRPRVGARVVRAPRRLWAWGLAAAALIGVGVAGGWLASTGASRQAGTESAGTLASVERETPVRSEGSRPGLGQRVGVEAEASAGAVAKAPETRSAPTGETAQPEQEAQPEQGYEAARAAEAIADAPAAGPEASSEVAAERAEPAKVEPPVEETAAQRAAREARERQEARRATQRAAALTAEVETARTRAMWVGMAALKREREEAERLRLEAERRERVAAWEAKKREQEAAADARAATVANPQATAAVRPTSPSGPTTPTTPAPATPRPPQPDPDLRRALLSSVPPGAAVLVDGKSVGRTPMTLTWAPNTTSSVWVTMVGYEPANFQVGEKQHGKMMRLELVPAGGAPED